MKTTLNSGPAVNRFRRAKTEMEEAKKELKVLIQARLDRAAEIIKIPDNVVMPLDVARAQREWDEYVALVNIYPDDSTFSLDLGFERLLEKMKKNAEKNAEAIKVKLPF